MSDIQFVSQIYLDGDSDDIQITKDEVFMVVANGGTSVEVVNITDKRSP